MIARATKEISVTFELAEFEGLTDQQITGRVVHKLAQHGIFIPQDCPYIGVTQTATHITYTRYEPA